MRLVDYVVVHELVHLRHRGHGRDYWQALGRVMPRLRASPRGPATARVTVGVVTDWLWQTPLRFFRQRPSPNPCGNDTIRRRAFLVNVINNYQTLATGQV